MRVLGGCCREWSGRAGGWRGFAVLLVAGLLAAGCEHPFEPYEENEGAIFSMFGYLDSGADVQWVRVMPVRQDLLLDPAPIDAVVTLEHLGSGRTVTLRDSLFQYVDPRLDGVGYAYNFWTTERLEPEATYRLRATRSDGAWTEATIEMPADFEFTYLNDVRYFPDRAILRIRADHLLFVEVIHAMGGTDPITGGILPGGVGIATRDNGSFTTDEPGMQGVIAIGDAVSRPGLQNLDRKEIRIAVARPDWPYHAELPDLVVTLPGTMPSNVERGLGFVGGVRTWTIPFHRCEMLATSDERESPCTTRFDAQAASISGRVMREPCDTPHELADIRLTERFADGGAAIRTWRTGWDGSYRFEGIEAGAELLLDLGAGTQQVNVPRLAAGERHVAQDLSVWGSC